jgi:hypothetical protein
LHNLTLINNDTPDIVTVHRQDKTITYVDAIGRPVEVDIPLADVGRYIEAVWQLQQIIDRIVTNANDEWR